MRVYVLLFNPGSENEGIHTLRIGDRDTILMFESEDDATRYALLLEAQDFLSPSVEPIDAEEVKAVCESADYDWKIVPAGFIPQDDSERHLLAPPENNLPGTTWQPDAETAPPPAVDPDLERFRRQLEGLFRKDE